MSVPPATRPAWRIKPLHVEGLRQTIELPPAGLVVGRDPLCDVVVAGDVHGTVSARHLRLRDDGDAVVVVDEGSRNGTLVGGRAVSTARLTHGEVFQLGPGGPRFAVLAPTQGMSLAAPAGGNLARTAFARVGSLDEVRADVEAAAAATPVPASPPDSRPDGVRYGGWLVTGTLVALFAIALRSVPWGQAGPGSDERVAGAIVEFTEQRETWIAERAAFDAARSEWEAARRRSESERDTLALRLSSLEAAGATIADIEDLARQLEVARAELARFDPESVERVRADHIGRVERAVVLIEAREVLLDPKTDRVLHAVEVGGSISYNLTGRGTEFARESTGSGLCVSADGYVLTNAHVVDSPRGSGAVATAVGVLEPRRRLEVVFSGTSRRHRAELVALRHDERHDLALLRIEPFDGMPFFGEIDTTLSASPRGTEVFAIGFPLGTRVLQDGDTVIASAFRGIVSRTVDPWIQIDAAVHPGASGGPVIDANGRVVGLVTAMQSADPRAVSSQIGYMLPIERVSAVWPRR